MERPLADDEKRFLLRLARETLQARFESEPLPLPDPPAGPLTQPRGAFVTLTSSGELRGCIGHVVGVAPLWRSVRENALNAAFRDPRFEPVEAAELASLHIEISALTPLREVTAPEEVTVGRHGVMIENGPFRGLLLPQVATEYGWDWETFLDHTCHKAGLQAGCWRLPDTRILVFSAEVFSE
jgi:AmmeMemoRadiSam system protein A